MLPGFAQLPVPPGSVVSAVAYPGPAGSLGAGKNGMIAFTGGVAVTPTLTAGLRSAGTGASIPGNTAATCTPAAALFGDDGAASRPGITAAFQMPSTDGGGNFVTEATCTAAPDGGPQVIERDTASTLNTPPLFAACDEA